MDKLRSFSCIKSILIIPFVFLLYSPSFALATDCNKAEAANADRLLWLNARDQELARKAQLPWGIPVATLDVDNEVILTHRDYTINYDGDLLVPLWVAYQLNKKGLGKVDRIDCFRRDPRIDAPAASLPSDYLESTFDQGHLAPNGDMSRALNPVLNSFIMSNMAPQFCQFNRGVWQILESMVRIWVKNNGPGAFYIISGSVFDRDGDGIRDDDDQAKRMKSKNGKARVAIPSHFYKILMHQNLDGSVQSISFLMPNDQTDLDGEPAFDYIANHITSIADIQAITGIRFFPGLENTNPGSEEDLIEAKATGLWPLTGKQPKSLTNTAQCKATVGFNF